MGSITPINAVARAVTSMQSERSTDATRLGYLDLAYRLGREFATDRDAAEAALA
jgi:hypothetical protein